MFFYCFCSRAFFFFLSEIFGFVSWPVMFSMNSLKLFTYLYIFLIWRWWHIRSTVSLYNSRVKILKRRTVLGILQSEFPCSWCGITKCSEWNQWPLCLSKSQDDHYQQSEGLGQDERNGTSKLNFSFKPFFKWVLANS